MFQAPPTIPVSKSYDNNFPTAALNVCISKRPKAKHMEDVLFLNH